MPVICESLYLLKWCCWHSLLIRSVTFINVHPVLIKIMVDRFRIGNYFPVIVEGNGSLH